MQENADHNNSEYGQFSRSVSPGYRLNVHKTFRRRAERLQNVLVLSIYVLCPRGTKYTVICRNMRPCI